MKKITKIIAAIAIMMILIPIQETRAATFSINAPSSVSPGQTFFVGIGFQGEGTFSISVSNGSGGASGFWYPDSTGTNVTAGSSGSVTVTVTANDATTTSEVYIGGESASVTIPIVANTGGGNTGSGNTGGGNTNTGGSEGTYNPNVNPETEEEKAAREAREKEAELEEKRKNSLIESIEIVSNEEKRKGETLKSLELEGEKYDYAYTLPTFMSKITLNVKASDDVQLEYVKEHEITGAKEIKIKAVSGEITQDFVLTLDSSNSEVNKTEDGFIYYDEKLDEAFKDLGFESKTLEADDKKLSVFNRNKLNLQMIVNDDHEVLFYNLDEKGALLDKGQLLVSDKDVLFVVEEAEADLLDKKLYGNAYDKVDLPKPDFLEALDPTLTVKKIASGWVFEDGSIVSAYNDNLDKDLYHIVSKTPFKAAVVAFDGKSDSNITFALIASLIALLGISVAFVLYHLKTKKKIQLLLGRKEI